MTDEAILTRLSVIGYAGPRCLIEAAKLLEETGRDWVDRISAGHAQTGPVSVRLGLMTVKIVIMGYGPSPLEILADCANDE